MKEKASFGDKVRLSYNGAEIEGTFISHESGIITVKLKNGYNVALSDDRAEYLSVTRVKRPSEDRNGEREISGGVILLATGGTIASRVDYATGAVKPHYDISSLLGEADIREKLGTKVIDNILSENVTPEKWILMAEHTKKELDKGNHVIILHGTDTMTYSASALSFMFEKQSRSIIFTGSQRSPDRPSSDAFENIRSAITFSSLNVGEVSICMHDSRSDLSERLIRATRSRKMHTSRRDAIRDIDGGGLAGIRNGKVSILGEFRPAADETVLSAKLDNRVALVYFYPGMESGILSRIAEKKKALVVMGTGLGHVSEAIISEIRGIARDGVHVVMTSQCLQGNVNLNIYSTGRKLKDAGVISAGDILPEVAFTKAMYVLANHGENFGETMMKSLRGEISARLLN
ncbi:MAG: Glu-tRNA(Gln) amidotransferase subunit GatD [Candidatus Thermoplasmatota archaeon]|nr:Glu-tRNA(Gln) amidotransferase subunit GatD [Candidatus Thermoplasmatota archaeon]